MLAEKLDSHQLAAANSSTSFPKLLAEQLALATLISFDARSLHFPFLGSSTPVLPVTSSDQRWVTLHTVCLVLALLLVTCASLGGKKKEIKKIHRPQRHDNLNYFPSPLPFPEWKSSLRIELETSCWLCGCCWLWSSKPQHSNWKPDLSSALRLTRSF